MILSAPVRYTKFLESNRASARRVATCPGPVILVTIALDQLGTETPGSKAHNASQLCWKRTLPVWPPLTLPVGDHGAWRFPSSIIHELFVEYRTLAFEVGSIAAHAQAHKQIFALIYELQSEVNSRPITMYQPRNALAIRTARTGGPLPGSGPPEDFADSPSHFKDIPLRPLTQNQTPQTQPQATNTSTATSSNSQQQESSTSSSSQQQESQQGESQQQESISSSSSKQQESSSSENQRQGQQ